MYITKKVRLFPTQEQEILMRKTAGCCRFLYNWYIDEFKQGNISNYTQASKKFTQLKKQEEYIWLNEPSRHSLNHALQNAYNAYQDFFNHKKGYPKYKSKNNDEISFYVRSDSSIDKKSGRHKHTFYQTTNGVKIEKLGIVKTNQPLPKIPKNQHYYNATISYDNKYWYLSVSYIIQKEDIELTDKSIGIDLGIKDLAITSYHKKYRNVNKHPKMKRIEKKIKRKQRKLQRQRDANKNVYIKEVSIDKNGNEIISKRKKKLSECKNYQKTRKEIQLLYRKQRHIRENHIYLIINEIVRTKPSRIVMETLSPHRLMKNKYLAKSIQEAKWRFFINHIKNKCKRYGIEFVQADQFFPSTQKCNKCGNVKKGKEKLKLDQRVYRCFVCGNVIDRDINASINLAKY